MHRRSFSRRTIFLLFFCALVMIASAIMSTAQSGRRIPKKNNPPPLETTLPEPPKTTEQPAPEKPAPETPRTPILVVRYVPGVYTSYIAADIVTDGCAARLGQSASLSVRKGKEMTRKGASDFAKNSSDTYVAWLEIQSDQSGMTTRDDGTGRYSIAYTLFIPGTGKTKTSGRIYPRQYQPNVGGLPLPVPTSRAPAEYILRQAGEDAADRMMNAMDLIIPRR
jgi:hypothetical protein